MLESIEASKAQPFSRVLFGLNIPDVGWVTAQNLVRHFGVVDRLLDATQEQIQEVDGIGPDRAESIAEWFSDEQNRVLVQELRELGLRFEVGEEERPVEGPLSGAQYVITGTLEGFTREEAAAALLGLGAKVSDNVSKKTAGVIVGESPGSKVAKAQKAGVALLTEADLRKLLKDAGSRPSRPSSRLPAAARARPRALRRSGPARAATSRWRRAPRSGSRRRRSGRGRSRRARSDARRPGLRDHPAARRPRLEPVLERSVDAGDRERGDEGVAEIGSGQTCLEQRDHGGSGDPVVPREPRAVDQANAVERHAGVRDRCPHDARRARSCPAPVRRERRAA